MHQFLAIAKIAGVSSRVIAAQFRRWARMRRDVEEDFRVHQSDRWAPEQRREMDALADALRANAAQPPVVFFNEDVDTWSMGDIFLGGFPENSDALYQVIGETVSMLCYVLPDDGLLDAHLRRRLRRRNLFPETRWYYQRLLEALHAWEENVPESVLIVVRRVLGGLLSDAEIEASAKMLAPWLQEYEDRE